MGLNILCQTGVPEKGVRDHGPNVQQQIQRHERFPDFVYSSCNFEDSNVRFAPIFKTLQTGQGAQGHSVGRTSRRIPQTRQSLSALP